MPNQVCLEEILQIDHFSQKLKDPILQSLVLRIQFVDTKLNICLPSLCSLAIFQLVNPARNALSQTELHQR
jgi:hypothetical protein